MSVPLPTASRRDFLQRTGAGFGAVALSGLLQGTAGADSPAAMPVIDPLNPFAPRRPHFRPRAKSVIFLFMVEIGRAHV